MWDARRQVRRCRWAAWVHRWGSEKGKWNLELKDGQDGSEIDPLLTFLEDHDGVASRRVRRLRRGHDHSPRSAGQERCSPTDGKTVLVADGLRPADGPVRGVPRAGRASIRQSYDDDTALHAGVGGESTPAWAARC